MTDVPLGISKASHPQALHVQSGSGINDQLAIVALGDGTVLMSEQDSWSLLHCISG